MDWFGSWCQPQKQGVINHMETKGDSEPAPSAGVPSGLSLAALTQSFIAPAEPTQSSGTSTNDKSGIGVILALSPDNSLYVHTVCPGGSSEGRLFPGDVLVKIGQEDVFCAPPGHVAELLLGRQGSVVEVWVRRPKNPNASELQFTTTCVKLVRKRVDPFRSENARGRNFSSG